jgi:hypothetical protein
VRRPHGDGAGTGRLFAHTPLKQNAYAAAQSLCTAPLCPLPSMPWLDTGRFFSGGFRCLQVTASKDGDLRVWDDSGRCVQHVVNAHAKSTFFNPRCGGGVTQVSV